MTLVNNRFNFATEFFNSHSPYVIPQGSSTSYSLKDLVFINYNVPTFPIKINQQFGAVNVFNFVITVTNLTSNISFEVEVVSEEFFKIQGTKKFQLRPTTQISVPVEVDNNYINSLNNISSIFTDFKILVRNLTQTLPIKPSRPPLVASTFLQENSVE